MTINHAPSIEVTEPDGVSDTAHAFYTVQWNGWDPDPGDALIVNLYYDVDTDPAAKTFLHSDPDNTGAYLWETSDLNEGTYYIYAEISDGVNPTMWDYSDGPVTIDHPNIPPTLVDPPDQVLWEDDELENAFDLKDYASDYETPTSDLGFTIVGNTNPNCGVTIDANDHVDIAPAANWYGSSVVTVQVSDGEDTDTGSFTVTVQAVNDLPWISPTVPDQSEAQDQPITIDLTAYEHDVEDSDTALDWYVTGAGHCTVSGEYSDDDVLTFTPDGGFASSDTVTLHLVDSGGGVDTQVVTLAWSNTSPTISGLPDRTLDEDTSLDNTTDLWAYASDGEAPDSGLTYAIDNSPDPDAGVAIDANRYIDVNPTANWCGWTDVTIRVTDPGGLWDTDIFRVMVDCLNDLPWISPTVPDQSEAQDQPITIDLTAYEHDVEDSGTALDWYVTGEDHCTVSGEYGDDDVLTFSPNTGFVGDDYVTLHLKDSEGAEDTQQVNLNWTGSGDLLLFGGLGTDGTYNDTWTLNGTDWAEVGPTAPTSFPRAGHGMVYDVGHGRVVLFGGNLSGGSEPTDMLSDTWEYVDGSWLQVETANAPSPRMVPAMAYDSGRGVTVLFGGYDGPWGVCATSAYTDTWEYDGTNWRQITTTHTPPQFVQGSMVYDEARGKIVLFSGWECQGFGWENETWEYDGTDWTMVTSGPLGGNWRNSFAMAYDRDRERVVLFGGWHHGGSGGLNDTWEYDGQQWTQINTSHAPAGRWDHMMAYDETRQAAVLFGGFDASGYLADTWKYDGADWQPITTTHQPPARKQSALVLFESGTNFELTPTFVVKNTPYAVQVYTLTLTNNSTTADTFDFTHAAADTSSLSGSGLQYNWGVELSSNSLEIGPGLSETLQITVQVPTFETTWVTHTLSIMSISTNHPAQYATSTLKTHTGGEWDPVDERWEGCRFDYYGVGTVFFGDALLVYDEIGSTDARYRNYHVSTVFFGDALLVYDRIGQSCAP